MGKPETCSTCIFWKLTDGFKCDVGFVSVPGLGSCAKGGMELSAEFDMHTRGNSLACEQWSDHNV